MKYLHLNFMLKYKKAPCTVQQISYRP